MLMNYEELLKNSSEQSGNCACIGIDIVPELLPENCSVDTFIEIFLGELYERKLIPAAFKPNIAYFSSFNQAYRGNFSGYMSLSKMIALIRKLFPHVPIILDAKRGDIASSSTRYAMEIFESWTADATTVSPYMGHDSVLPFRNGFENKGVYVLNRTSNKGAVDLQNQELKNGQTVYMEVARQILEYAKAFPGTGAVVGASSLKELRDIAQIYRNTREVPLLIPGVGAQGGSAVDVITCLKELQYDLRLVRINSSSGLTFPWKKEKIAPNDWLAICMNCVEKFLQETRMNE